MRIVLQRVTHANCVIDGEETAKIGRGLLGLVGVGKNTTEEEMRFLANKMINLRIFPDEERKMNLSVMDIKGDILLISQFTLYADCRKGRRPSYTEAAPPDEAAEKYERFVEIVKEIYPYKTESGIFQAMMKITLCNDGPVTIIFDGEVMAKKQ